MYYKVKSIRGIHFYDIVPVDHLLERFALDAGKIPIAEAMTELMLNSFYPQGTAMGQEQTQRCLKFIDENAIAAEAFYHHFYKFTSVGSATKLCTMLFSLISQVTPKKCSSSEKELSSTQNSKVQIKLLKHSVLFIFFKNFGTILLLE